jgi:hypothetical protein
MTRDAFRFRPPPDLALPAELDRVLAHAFALRPPAAPPDPLEPALELAARLALLPRWAARADSAALDRDPRTAGAAARLRRERADATVRELQLDRALAEVADAAAGLGVELALLKGRALVLGGWAAPGSRPAGDLDLLVDEPALAALAAALRRRGFRPGPSGSDHHAPALERAGLGRVELHRHLPGVRLAGRRFADWRALAAAGLLPPLADGPFAGLRTPTRELLLAHALVHALAQHGMHTTYPGWLLVGDLLDLGAIEPPTVAESTPAWYAWIARDVSRREVAAAVELARCLAAGEPFAAAPPSADAARLARHFTACALDADYREALKTRWLEAPMSEGSIAVARLRWLARTLTPPPLADGADRAVGRTGRLLRWIARPFVLARKLLRSLLARRRLKGANGVAGRRR